MMGSIPKHSPSDRAGKDSDGDAIDTFEHRQPALSLPQLLALTCPNFGIQVLWLIMMSYGTPYMVGLGMPTSVTAMVWIAGPLSGAFAQPLFAGLSDSTRHPWGKRKPFISAGAACAALSLLGLAYADDISIWLSDDASSRFTYGPGMSRPKANILTQTLVVFWAWMLCLSIQPLQCGVRALIVDCAPAEQQSSAAAWSARFNGLGAVLTSASAFPDLSQLAPFLGDSTFKGLCVLGVVTLCCTVAIVCFAVEDKPAERLYRDTSPMTLIAKAWHTLRNLPPVSKQVCKIQFFAWTGWFIVLYYSTTYVYQTFISEEHAQLDPEIWYAAKPQLVERGKNAGDKAAFVIASVSFTVSMIIPFLARTAAKSNPASLPTVSIFGLSISRIWQLAHILFAGLMFSTFFVSTTFAATAVVGSVAVGWALASWIPYALISAEAATLKSQGIAEKGEGHLQQDEMSASIIGSHNMAISLPQILAALGCTVLFKVVEMAGREDTVGFAFKIAGGMAAVAAYFGRGLE